MGRRTRITALLAGLAVGGCAASGAVGKGDRLADEQRWDDAVAAYQEAADKAPGDDTIRSKLDSAKRAAAAYHHVIGREKEASKQLAAALVAYGKALAHQPGHEAARTDRSKVARLTREQARAVVAAERLLERGDCIAAKAAFEALLPWKHAFPRTESGRVDAMKSCFDKAVAAADVLIALGAFDRADSLLDKANALYPNHPEVARRRAATSGSLAAASLLGQGETALVRGRYPEAVAALKAALEKDPNNPGARDGFEAARALAVRDLLRQASRDLKRKRRKKTLATLEQALAVGHADAAVTARIDAAVIDLRNGAAARLYRRGQRADTAGLFGAAWIWYRLSDLVGRRFADADLRARTSVARINQVVPYRILVVPPVHTSAFPWLGLEVAEELAAALVDDLAGTSVTLTFDPNVQPPPDGVLRGKLTQFDLAPPKTVERIRPTTWKLPDRLSTNPAIGEVYKAWVAAAKLGDKDKEAEALKALQATDVTRKVPGGERVLDQPVTDVIVTGAAGAELELYDRANDKVVTAAYADARVEVRTLAAAALPAAGLAGNAGSVPAALALRRRMALSLVEDLREQLSPALRQAGVRFERLSERVTGDARLHYVVLALVAGTPNAEALKQELLEATGYKYGDDTYDAGALPF
jgi:tetratricopeptide (TPR) repeat protein